MKHIHNHGRFTYPNLNFSIQNNKKYIYKHFKYYCGCKIEIFTHFNNSRNKSDNSSAKS